MASDAPTLSVASIHVEAVEQRLRLHHHLQHLRNDLREKLDITKHVRQHLGFASAMAGAVALACGYASAGLFTRR
jgi:hypothetical protein